jgi:hypothetical protein
MFRREIITLTVMIVFGFSIIISFPIIFISLGYSPYKNIGHQDSIEGIFNSSNTVDLNLYIDIGEVDIHYTFSPVDYHVKINYHIDLISQNIPKTNHTDFFNIEWEKTDESFIFTMELITNISYLDTVLIEHNVNIIVILNPIILFNINSEINIEGNFKLQGFGINTNNINVYTRLGNIIFNFGWCNIGGNIYGNSRGGDIELNLINVQYSRNSAWNLTTNPEGIIISDILINITQNTAIKVNITATAITTIGDITLHYTDTTSFVGANFTFYRRTPQGASEGFDDDIDIDTDKWWQVRYYYYSYDYPAIGNYNISCYALLTDYGTYFINLKNV